ncbi:hypothetical protein CDD83_6183 [Cordyceps sp. RAO-2017]|nr:hypothetical protein CDD83_6183 [Cordyceps sp. RAO-2017]
MGWLLRWPAHVSAVMVGERVCGCIKPAISLFFCLSVLLSLSSRSQRVEWTVESRQAAMGTTKHKVLINCDMGEAYGNYACGPDEELLPLIDLANVACGFQ